VRNPGLKLFLSATNGQVSLSGEAHACLHVIVTPDGVDIWSLVLSASLGLPEDSSSILASDPFPAVYDPCHVIAPMIMPALADLSLPNGRFSWNHYIGKGKDVESWGDQQDGPYHHIQLDALQTGAELEQRRNIFAGLWVRAQHPAIGFQKPLGSSSRGLFSMLFIPDGGKIFSEKHALRAAASSTRTYVWELTSMLLRVKEHRPLMEYILWYFYAQVKEVELHWDADDERICAEVALEARWVFDEVKHLYNAVVVVNLAASNINDPVYYAGLYRRLSFINHSCQPNASIDVTSDGVATLTALEALEPGDEITICYLGPDAQLHPRAVFRAMIKLMYGFDCKCRRCREEQPLFHSTI
jgi:hypothetical protein